MVNSMKTVRLTIHARVATNSNLLGLKIIVLVQKSGAAQIVATVMTAPAAFGGIPSLPAQKMTSCQARQLGEFHRRNQPLALIDKGLKAIKIDKLSV